MKLPHAMLVLLCLAAPGTAAVTAFGPTKYLQTSDSPWFDQIQSGTFFLEDFRDGLLNTPFVTSNGHIQGLGDTRSVDADDGVLDGNGQCCGTWGIDAGLDMEFSFRTNEKGLLPAFVGIVVTRTARSIETMSIYDDADVKVGALQFDLTPVFNKAANIFDVSESRFIGIYFSGGISRISLQRANMADHLQYGYAIPEPASVWLALSALVCSVFRRRR